MRCKALIGVAEAEAKLGRKHLGLPRLLRWRGRQSPVAGRRLPYLELVWLPYYLLVVEASLNGTAIEAACLVDGMSGEAARLRLDEETLELRDGEEWLAPRISQGEAEARGREFLRRLGLASRRRRLRLGPTKRLEPVQYPYWVYYYERRRGRIDIRVLDAVNGSRAGAGVKRSVLMAFAEVAKFSGEPSQTE